MALLVTYILPATALFWGWLILHEQISHNALLGLALIIAGIALVNSVWKLSLAFRPVSAKLKS